MNSLFNTKWPYVLIISTCLALVGCSKDKDDLAFLALGLSSAGHPGLDGEGGNPGTTEIPGSGQQGQASSGTSRSGSTQAAATVIQSLDLSCPKGLGLPGLSGDLNSNQIVVTADADYSERFASQNLTVFRSFDLLDSGAAGSPLALTTGERNENLLIMTYDGKRTVTGLGPLGYPDYDAIGEGAVAIHLTTPASVIGFTVVGGNNGSVFVQFFGTAGEHLGTSVVGAGFFSAPPSYRFRLASGALIAGVSIHNTDPWGVGYNALCVLDSTVGSGGAGGGSGSSGSGDNGDSGSGAGDNGGGDSGSGAGGGDDSGSGGGAGGDDSGSGAGGDGDSGSNAGGSNAKVQICHHAADARRITLRVGQSSVSAHLAHGDSMGACN